MTSENKIEILKSDIEYNSDIDGLCGFKKTASPYNPNEFECIIDYSKFDKIGIIKTKECPIYNPAKFECIYDYSKFDKKKEEVPPPEDLNPRKPWDPYWRP